MRMQNDRLDSTQLQAMRSPIAKFNPINQKLKGHSVRQLLLERLGMRCQNLPPDEAGLDDE